jgi:hypothetical protein
MKIEHTFLVIKKILHQNVTGKREHTDRAREREGGGGEMETSMWKHNFNAKDHFSATGETNKLRGP